METNNLNEQELEAIGQQVVEWFGLKKDLEHKNRYVTEIGTKTLLGLGRSIVSVVERRGQP